MPAAGPTPLSPAAFQILITVAGGRRHGYAIMKEVAAAEALEAQLNPGTLYTTIRRLLEDGLIRETSAPGGAGSSGQRRRYYEITAEGRKAALGELQRLRSLVEHARSRLVRTRA